MQGHQAVRCIIPGRPAPPSVPATLTQKTQVRVILLSHTILAGYDLP